MMLRTLGKGTFMVVAAACTVAWAQEAKPAGLDASDEMELLMLLNTPVKGASKREQRLIDSPQAIEVLTGEEIRQMGIYRVQDALKLMTGVDILEQDNGFNVVGMRGIMQQGQPRTVQVLVDGVPLYNTFASSIDVGNLPVPIDVIDRVEVVRGPSSTLYGANAVVGVIAISTKKAGSGAHGTGRFAKADKSTSRWGGALEAGNGTFGFTAGFQGSSQGNTGRTAYNVGDVNKLAPLTLTAGQYPDAGHQSSASARIDWKNDSTNVWFSTGMSQRKYGQFQQVQSRLFENATFLFGWHQNWTNTFGTELRVHQLSQVFHFEMEDATAQSYAMARKLMGFQPVDISSNYTFCDATTQQIELQANWDPSKDLHFVFGADTRKLDIKKVVFLGVNKDEKPSASGGFVAMDWTFQPQWTLSLGARAENETLGGSRTSPRATLVWAPTNSRVFRLGYFTSTRSPQVAETSVDYLFPSVNKQLGGQAPLYLVASAILPNTSLKPEKSSNIELGYRQSVGNLTIDATVYQTKITNQITSVSLGTRVQVIQVPVSATVIIPENVPIFTTQFQNRGNATNMGAEVALTWVIDKDWKAGVNGRYLDYTQDEKGSLTTPPAWNGEFSYAPKHLVTAWTRFAKGKWSGYFDVQHVASAHVEALTASGITLYDERDAYLQVDAQVGYELVKGCTVSLSARNAAREFTQQGGAGPDRPFVYQVARRELGASLVYRF